MNGKVLIGAAAAMTLAAAIAAVLVWSVPPGEVSIEQAATEQVVVERAAVKRAAVERAAVERAASPRDLPARHDEALDDDGPSRPAAGVPASDRPDDVPPDDNAPEGVAPDDAPPEADVPVDEQPRDEQPREEAPHADPVHREVLGRRGWMAALPPEEIERIDRTIDEAERRRDELFQDLELRRLAIAQAQQVGEVCFDALFNRVPEASGRVIVNFEAIAHLGGVTITNARVAANVGLQDLAFENCLITGIDRIAFGTDAPDGAMWIEHAMYFEDE